MKQNHKGILDITLLVTVVVILAIGGFLIYKTRSSEIEVPANTTTTSTDETHSQYANDASEPEVSDNSANQKPTLNPAITMESRVDEDSLTASFITYLNAEYKRLAKTCSVENAELVNINDFIPDTFASINYLPCPDDFGGAYGILAETSDNKWVVVQSGHGTFECEKLKTYNIPAELYVGDGPLSEYCDDL